MAKWKSQTKGGKPVRILAEDRDYKEYPIVGLMRDGDHEIVRSWTPEGKSPYTTVNESDDLDPVMMDRWIVIYRNTSSGALYVANKLYKTEEGAQEAVLHNPTAMQIIKVSVNDE